MSRSRNIKPGFFKNEVLVQLPFEQRLLFIGLWTIADRAGRFEDRPTRIKMELFPSDNVDVDAGLQALHDNGFILRYSRNGAKYCQVLAWAKHQNPHCKEVESTIPAPCEHGASTVSAPEIPERAVLIPDSFHSDSINLIPNSKPSSSELQGSSDQVKAPQKKTPQPPSREACRLAALLKSEIVSNKSDYRITPSQERKWSVTADRMLRLDGRTPEQVSDLIRWVQRDEFWMANVLSMDTLREKFDQLQFRRQHSNGNGKAGPVKVPSGNALDYHRQLMKEAEKPGVI